MKRVFYPLSIPFEQLVSTYNPLIPAVPDGKKIVTVIFDAFREDYFGRTKNGIRLTPNMTSFAEDNSYFSNYYVQSNWTKPSVASFFTGQYVHEHVTVSGAGRQVLDRTGKTTIAEHSGHVLPERYSTLAERLRKQDFQNAAYVSIPHISKNYNFNQGFNYYGYRNLQSTPGNLFAVRSLLFWTVRNQPENLFLYLHLPGPHFGYEEGLYHNDSFWKKTDFETSMDMQQQWTLEKLPPELVEKSLDETLINQHQTEKSILELSYASDVNYYDKVIFPLITKSLKNIGMFQNSLFVLTSDHGELLWDHQGYYGHSQFLYEELINVPLLVKLPEGVQLKTAAAPPSQKPMLESLDLTATILNYAGASRKKIEGDPFYSFSRSNPVTHKKFSTAYAEEADGDQLIQATVIRPPWKYKYNYQHEEGKLFNLATSGESKQITDQGAVLNSLKNNLLNEFNPGGQFQNPPPDLKTYSGGELEQLRGMGYIN
ncbi:MAG: sulfatase-like hydrolase/transferase [bacterium]